jgi:hypothetical protein
VFIVFPLASSGGVGAGFLHLSIRSKRPKRYGTRGYLTSEKTGNGTASRTSIGLTGRGRAALEAYRAALRGLLGEL